jgi:hypothetical protein
MSKIRESIESMNIAIDIIAKYDFRQRRGTMTRQEALDATSRIMESHILIMKRLWESPANVL